MAEPRPATPGRLAVVVLTWNGREDTLRCLDALRPELGPHDTVLVADNGSHDGTLDAVRARHPWAETIQNGGNLGFAGGNNPALRAALQRGYRWILLLNNDTVVPPGALHTLLAHAEARPTTAAFQPLLVRADAPTTIDSAGHVVFTVPGAADARMGQPLANAPMQPVEIFGACGAAALLRSDALAAAGLLDERLFVLFEDLDLMFRLRLLGHRVELVPHVHVQHRRGVSAAPSRGPSRRRFWLHRNIVALALRYWPLHGLVVGAPLLLLRMLLACWHARACPGERCLPLWRSSLAARPAARAAMRRHGLDRWFGLAPA
jgi:hypothetical protein